MAEFKVKRRKIIIDDTNDKTNLILNLLKNQELMLDLLKNQDTIINVKYNDLKKEISELKYIIYEQNKILNDKIKVYENDMCNDMKNAYI